MQSQIFAELQKKHKPKEKNQNIVKTRGNPIESVIFKEKIYDKRDEHQKDRKKMLANIQEVSDITKIVPLIKTEKTEKTEKLEEPEKLEKPEKPEKPESISDIIRETPENLEVIKTIKVKKHSKNKEDKSLKDPTISQKTKILNSLKRTIQKTETLAIKDSLSDNEYINKIRPQLPKVEEKINMKASSYYMNNRKAFINFINKLFLPYQKEIKDKRNELNCDSKSDNKFSLLTHQKIVRDYINLYTPYRGLLLYHGLGSGKTCSSISIAEGLKTDKEIIIMTPASLRKNYIEELKKCGDELYKRNQYWEFIEIDVKKDKNVDLIEPLSVILKLPIEFIKSNKGAWLVNINKPSNYETLSSLQQESLDRQLFKMIEQKYYFIKYNGIRMKLLDELSTNNTINPFSNKVIIIDEAHNFVSRIVNKLKRSNTVPMRLYNYLMTAENCKIILLTGTPIINYPNELAIAMNIIRGKIKTFTFKLTVNTEKRVSEKTLNELFKKNLILDFIEYNSSNNELTITRNPYGFYSSLENKDDKDKVIEYKGVKRGNDGDITDDELISTIISILSDNNINATLQQEIIIKKDEPDKIKNYKEYNCLPDNLKDFSDYFINEDNTVKNMNLFKRRILGLVSYFPDIDELLPKYNKQFDFHIIKIEMSNFQFVLYEAERVKERQTDLNNARKRSKAAKAGKENVFEDSSSTYRIFSRAYCNFVFPEPDIMRPMPKIKKLESDKDKDKDNDDIDGFNIEQKKNYIIAGEGEEQYDIEEIEELEKTLKIKPELMIEHKNYEERIKEALQFLEANKDKYLTPEALETYSPKFLNILGNIVDDNNKGLHLIYSQFRTLEGIGILSLILKANGFVEFKITKDKEKLLDILPEDMDKPKFVLYTGTETVEEKEIMRNIFNSNWSVLPNTLRKQLQQISSNNFLGEIIKVFMITASGAEGISLSNVRYVHITEPYWHPVRTEQVVGRARRICSHKDLPKILQTVEVFLYLMTFTKEQKTGDKAIELIKNDTSKLDNEKIFTSDEALYEISTIKETINKEILYNIKEASIDCPIHAISNNKENLQCFTFGITKSDTFSYKPNISNDDKDDISELNTGKEKRQYQIFTDKGIEYVKDNHDTVYTKESYDSGNPIVIGRFTKSEDGARRFVPM